MSDIEHNESYREFLEATQAINAMGTPQVEMSIDHFKAKWLDRFAATDDTAVRGEWAKQVTGSPYARCHLVDKDGRVLAVVPAMLKTQGRYISHDIAMSEFLNNYGHAKRYARGHRATAMMNNLAANGVIANEFDIPDLNEWITLFNYFELNPVWVENARRAISPALSKTIQKNLQANDVVTDSGATHAFASADDYEPL